MNEKVDIDDKLLYKETRKAYNDLIDFQSDKEYMLLIMTSYWMFLKILS